MACVRSFRACGVTMLDTTATIALAPLLGFGIARLLRLPAGGALAISAAALPVVFGVGILAHQLSGTNTPLNYALGIGAKPAATVPQSTACQVISAVLVVLIAAAALWLSYKMMV